MQRKQLWVKMGYVKLAHLSNLRSSILISKYVFNLQEFGSQVIEFDI